MSTMTTRPAQPPRWRYDVELTHHTVLARAMQGRGFSVRGLAKRVGCAESVIGHMRSGRRKTCSPEVAREIEKALDVIHGMVFVSRISAVGGPAVQVPPRQGRRR